MDNWSISPPHAAPPAGSPLHGPTFTAPDLTVPELLAGDLTGPGLDLWPEMEGAPAPGTLLQYDQPGDLTIEAANADMVHELALEQHAYPPDLTLLPDQADTEVPMSERPGDLAGAALNEIQADPLYQALPTHDLKQLFMTQDGANSRRTRHLGMLELGLENEEHRHS